jgi:hypothetical protein
VVEPTRVAGLVEAKARALVRDHFGTEALTALRLPGGAAFHDDHRVWVYAPDEGPRALGRGLALAVRAGADEVHVIVDSDDGDLARRASLLQPPAQVWRADGRALVAVAPAPLPVEMEPPVGADHLLAIIRGAGADVVVEHGVIFGEIRGLEVARVRVGDDGRVTLDVGVGRFDQEATALLHGHLPTEAALARAVEEVRRHRRSGAAPHPVNRLARDRWLRAQLLDDPSIVGLATLEPVAPASPRRNTRDALPAGAVGTDVTGARVLVVCSVGVDLDLVPVAADLSTRERVARIVLVTPPRDQVSLLRPLADRLALPTELRAVEGDWPS